MEQFICFGQLLPELRDKIWNHALSDPHVIKIYAARTNVYNSHMSKAVRKALTTLLTTCWESYAAVMRCYKYMNFDVASIQTIKYRTMWIHLSPHRRPIFYHHRATHPQLISTPPSQA